MTTAIEEAIIAGVQLQSWSNGEHYSLCPKCSATRKPEHRRQKCLHVTVETRPQKVLVFCNHCPWAVTFFGEGEDGGREIERKGTGMARRAGPGRRFGDPIRRRKPVSAWR